jgi:TPR repeat protein
MAIARLLIITTAVSLGLTACSGGHYRNNIPGAYGSSFSRGVDAARERDYEEAAEQYGYAAESGHPRALVYYAELIASGRGVERDPLLASQLLEDAHSKSSNYKSRAALSLGRLLIDGGEGPSGSLQPDQERALVLLEEALEGGETRAGRVLGRMYDEGIGTNPDIEKAIGYYERVASEDARSAQRLASLLVETGASQDRIAKVTNNAITQLEQQARNGRNYAWIQLADIYMRDELVDSDPEKALSYLQNVADGEDPTVLARLADVYGELGDPVKEREMLRKAADKGDIRAQTQLAKLFLQPGTGDTNGAVGRYYAERAIAKGSKAAMVYLGIALIRGQVVEADPGAGETLLRRASSTGHGSATTALGLALMRDEIQSRYPDEGKKILETAAENGSTAAMTALGFAYQTGRGLPRNEALALEWLERAADAGHPKAKKFMAEQAGA